MKICKRTLVWLLILVLSAGLLAGCQSADPTDPTPTDPTPTEPPAPTEPPKPTAEERGYYLAEDYLADPTLFVPKWAGEWEVPAEMLDWEEKKASFYDPAGRVMSIGHRGDRNVLYPENSIEGFLSVMYAGVDIFEVDVVKTKDNVVIVFHDDDLLRCTDLTIRRLNGEADHLPTSNLVRDWTLDEIRQLRLVMTETSNETTNYVVPTLEDVLMLAKGRVFVSLDKVRRLDWNQDVVPVIEKVGCPETVLIPFQYLGEKGPDTLQFMVKRLYNAGAEKVPMFCQVGASNVDSVVQTIEQYGFNKGLRCGEYTPGNTALDNALKPYVGQYRFFFETLERSRDFPEVWEEMADKGYNTIMTNVNPYGLCKFVQERYFSGN